MTLPKEALNELASRVESAKGPERELDLAIQRARRTCVVPADMMERLEGAQLFGGRGSAFHDSHVHETGYVLGALPRFTASLDAAMTLAPEGWDYTIDRVNGRGAVQIFSDRKLDAEGSGIGATPALALTAASLRAIAEQVME